jgi:hypothetical protein
MSNMPIQHPLDSVFNMREDELDIEQQYSMTEVPVSATPVAPTEAPVDLKDEDDKLIEQRIDEVYDSAIAAFQNQSAYLEVIEPRFAARNAEVAANYLNIALAAANSRAKVKTDRKRANAPFVPFNNNGGKTVNNMIVASREEMLRMITIDTEPKELK